MTQKEKAELIKRLARKARSGRAEWRNILSAARTETEHEGFDWKNWTRLRITR